MYRNHMTNFWISPALYSGSCARRLFPRKTTASYLEWCLLENVSYRMASFPWRGSRQHVRASEDCLEQPIWISDSKEKESYQWNEGGGFSGLCGFVDDNHPEPHVLEHLVVSSTRTSSSDHLCPRANSLAERLQLLRKRFISTFLAGRRTPRKSRFLIARHRFFSTSSELGTTRVILHNRSNRRNWQVTDCKGALMICLEHSPIRSQLARKAFQGPGCVLEGLPRCSSAPPVVQPP